MELTQDLVPIVCDVLNRIRSDDTSQESPGSLAEILQAQQELMKIEEKDDRFDNLNLVIEIKRLISALIPCDSSSGPEIGVSTQPWKGLDHLRREILSAVEASIAQLSDENMVHFVDYKKQKAGRGYSIFNFDDMPEFESLDGVIAQLSRDQVDTTPLEKLLQIEIDDLFGHPMWPDLLRLLTQKLARSKPGTTFRTRLLQVYHRLCSGLRGSPHQAVEIMCSWLIHCSQLYVAHDKDSLQGPIFSAPLNRSILISLLQGDKDLSGFVSLLGLIQEECVYVLEAPGFQKDGDILVFLLLQLLASGKITAVKEDEEETLISVFDIACFFLPSFTSFIELLSLRWSATSLYLHSVKSGFCLSLQERITCAGTYLLCEPVPDSDLFGTYAMAWLCSVKILLQLSLPFASQAVILELSVSSIAAASICHIEMPLCCEYEVVLESYRSCFEPFLNKRVNGLRSDTDSDSLSVNILLNYLDSSNQSHSLSICSGFEQYIENTIAILFRLKLLAHIPAIELFDIVSLVLKHSVSRGPSADMIFLNVVKSIQNVLENFTEIPQCIQLMCFKIVVDDFADAISELQVTSEVLLSVCNAWSQCLRMHWDFLNCDKALTMEGLTRACTSLSRLLNFWNSRKFGSKDESTRIVIDSLLGEILQKAENFIYVKFFTNNKHDSDLISLTMSVATKEEELSGRLLGVPKEGVPVVILDVASRSDIKEIDYSAFQAIAAVITMGTEIIISVERYLQHARLLLYHIMTVLLKPEQLFDEAVVFTLSLLCNTLSSLVDCNAPSASEVKTTFLVADAIGRVLRAPFAWDFCGTRVEAESGTLFVNDVSLLPALGSLISNMALVGKVNEVLKILYMGFVIDEDKTIKDAISELLIGSSGLNHPSARFIMRVFYSISWDTEFMMDFRKDFANNFCGEWAHFFNPRKRAYSDVDREVNSYLFDEETRGIDDFGILRYLILSRLGSFGTQFELGLNSIPLSENDLESWLLKKHSVEVVPKILCEPDMYCASPGMRKNCRSVVDIFWSFFCVRCGSKNQDVFNTHGLWTETLFDEKSLCHAADMLLDYAEYSGLFDEGTSVKLAPQIIFFLSKDYTIRMDGSIKMGPLLLILFCVQPGGVLDKESLMLLHRTWAQSNCSRLVKDAGRLVAGYRGGVTSRLFQSIACPVRIFIEKIISDWFLNWLPLCDVLFITGEFLISDADCGVSYPAIVAAALAIEVSKYLRNDDIEAGLFGYEIILKVFNKMYNCTNGSPLQQMGSTLNELTEAATYRFGLLR